MTVYAKYFSVLGSVRFTCVLFGMPWINAFSTLADMVQFLARLDWAKAIFICPNMGFNDFVFLSRLCPG